MNELAIQHIPESKYCFALNEKQVVLRLRIDKNDHPQSVKVLYGGKYTFKEKQHIATLERKYEDRLFAWYTAKLTLDDVRLVYVFQIENDGKVFYFSEDGLTETYDFELNFYNCFQYAYINAADITCPVKWMNSACFYQIFVERFNIGNRQKDMSYVNMKWQDLPSPKSFAGGDLQGITAKLDHLKRLGINALYLTPIFQSESNHKYDISDYYTVDKNFGGNEAFKNLVKLAHAQQIRVVLDAVFNHCSINLSQFQNVLKNGKDSPFYDWFIIKSLEPLEYECFAECTYMPKFNTSNPEVQQYLIDIATHWIKEYDIDGWRLDVSDEISHDFWRRFRKEVKAVKSDCIILGENWHDANKSLQGDEFDGIMNYAFTKACLDYFAFGTFTPKQFAEKLNEILMRNSDTVNTMMLNLLDSHDTHRFITETGSMDKLKCALALEYVFVGVPCLYYGTEIALEGHFDPDSRRAFDWDRLDEKSHLFKIIQILSALKANGQLAGSDIQITEQNDIIYVKRNNYLLIINGSEKSFNCDLANAIITNLTDANAIEPNGFALLKTV